ncbi:MAG: hypothetical protein PHX05_01765 [Acidobacteriota bacterium]|nr:hypothetical protein [Acidobacteriota bacterium]
MNKKSITAITMLALLLLAGVPRAGCGCTTAVVGPAAGQDGRPMLWKNRDTDFLNNKVLFVRESPFSYLALVNAGDRSGRWVYAGLNAAGFAIFNSVAYNLPENSGEMKDLEGAIMADALRTCASVADFEAYLKASLGPSLGSLANFGVIDAQGGSALFEVSNHEYKKFLPGDFPEKYIVNTNFARSGKEGSGAGYLRFERASRLFRSLPAGGISPRSLLTQLSRDTGHALVEQPSHPQFKTFTGKRPFWLCGRDTIDRCSTSAAVVIAGRKPEAVHSLATLWVQLGEPLFTIAVPLWVEAGTVPEALWQNATAPILVEAQRLQKLARPYPEGDRREYLDTTRLDNREKTGFLPRLLQAEDEIYSLTMEFLKAQHTAAELAAFQDQMTRKALAVLQAAH